MSHTIYIVRHTSVDVELGTCYGWLDVALSTTYKRELDIIRDKLSGITFERTYSSPLTRCVRLAKDLSSNITLDERLREINFGDWEGISWNDIYKMQQSGKWFNDYINERTPNGESFHDMRNRVEDFIDSLTYVDGNTLIVTHGGVMRALLVAFNEYDPMQSFDLELPYGSVIKIEL